MKITLLLAAMASLSAAIVAPLVRPKPIEWDPDTDNRTLEARDDAWPGWLECKQRAFKKPCTWTPSDGPDGEGALKCYQMKYTEGQLHPDISFGPDKNVICRLYDSSDCQIGGKPLNIISPGGDIAEMGKKAGSFMGDVPGFFSYRCRTSFQIKNDAAQSKYIPLPGKHALMGVLSGMASNAVSAAATSTKSAA
jgi:hypothetical protein